MVLCYFCPRKLIQIHEVAAPLSSCLPSFQREICYHSHFFLWASLVAQVVKNLPAMQEMWVQSLGQADTLEKEMATHSSILTQRIPWTEEPGGQQYMELQTIGHD